MWQQIQRHVFEATLRRYPAAGALSLAFALLGSLSEVQSRAAQVVPEALAALQGFERARPELEQLTRRAQSGPSSPDEWLALAFLADLGTELERGWAQFYVPLCSAHAEFGARAAELRRWLAGQPWAACLRGIEQAWSEAQPDALVDAVGAVCLADLPARAEPPSYRRLLGMLQLEAPFWSVTVAAYALEKLFARGRFELAWVPEQALPALSLLSNFHAFERGSWG